MMKGLNDSLGEEGERRGHGMHTPHRQMNERSGTGVCDHTLVEVKRHDAAAVVHMLTTVASFFFFFRVRYDGCVD